MLYNIPYVILCYVIQHMLKVMLHNICYMTYVTLYNISYVMLCYKTYLMVWYITSVMLCTYVIQHMLYNIRYVMIYNIC